MYIECCSNISRWAIFQKGPEKQSLPNSHDNYVSWSHFKDNYITYHLRPGNPLKSCPKVVIDCLHEFAQSTIV